MEKKVKDCPFCKGQPVIFKRYGKRYGEEYREMFFAYKVKCVNSLCLIQPQTQYWKYESEAIDNWNNRREVLDFGRPNVKKEEK